MAQQRHHGGHSHSHHHHHDNSYLTSTNKNDPGVRITRWGLAVNVVMAAGKAAGGYFLNSQSLLADAAHSFTDMVSDILTLGTVAWSLKSPTERFPSGYGKIESLGSLGVSSLLLLGGLGLGLHSCEILYHMLLPGLDIMSTAGEHASHHHHGHGHDHGHGSGIFGHGHSHNPADLGIPNVHAAWIAGASILVKEYLYRATIKIARERKSSVLASNAIHHRIDSLTSVVALTAIIGSNIFSNIAWLDPVGGLLVSLMVIRAGWANTTNALLELADVSLDGEMKNSVRKVASKALQGASFAHSSLAGTNVEIRDVQGIKAGQSYLVEIQLGVPDSVQIAETIEIESTVRAAVASRVRGVRRVKVKFVPAGTTVPELDEFVPADMSQRSSPEPEENSHSHDHVHENGKSHDHKSSQLDSKKLS